MKLRIPAIGELNATFRTASEISRLRSQAPAGMMGKTFRLDSTRVDYEKARAIYRNTNEDYKLGAAFAKPVVNTAVGWMGVPSFVSEDQGAQDFLDDFFGACISQRQQVHRNALRDGDSYVWLTWEEYGEGTNRLYPDTPARLVFNVLPPDMVKIESRNPLTGAIERYELESVSKWYDANGVLKESTIKQTITAEARAIRITGDRPEGQDMETVIPNRWGFIPIVHFRNEWDGVSDNGVSELENIEPYMRSYHALLLAAIQASMVHDNKKLGLTVKDAYNFIHVNFGVEDPEKWLAEGNQVSFKDKDVLIFTDDEKAGYIEPQNGMGSASDLLKLLYYCIVDISETPEFAFGVHTPAALASAKEQMPILIRKVTRKREQFTDDWLMVARMALAIMSIAGGLSVSTYDTAIRWDKIDPRDEGEVAASLNDLVSGLAKAVESGIMSTQAASEFLAKQVDTMAAWISEDAEQPGERERIILNLIERRRAEDAALGAEKDAIDKILTAAKGGEA